MRSLFFDNNGDLRFLVILTLMFAVCIFVPTAAIYYTERYECKSVYAEQTGRNTQWRFGTCWVEKDGKFIPRKEIRTTEIK